MTEITNPRQVVLITTRAKAVVMGKEKENDNIFTIDWHMPTSFSPRLYAISVGKERFSYELLKESGCFVVNFMSPEYEKEILYCGRHSGRHIDKFKESKLTKEDADNIDCPRIKEALAYIECEIINQLETGDHVIFVGKIINSVLKNKGKRLFHKTGDDFTTTID
ncbi:flavin reductase family protein [Candidatus Woesearchaeota archaeon]|nr:flavin reductase family protein [Candidatus Woesearchaeota archaeon]